MFGKITAVSLAAAVTTAFLSLAPVQAAEVTLRLHTFIPPVANPAKTFLGALGEKDRRGLQGPNRSQDLLGHAVGWQSASIARPGA